MKTKNYDLTQGSPLKMIVLFTLPFLISLIFQQLYTAIDSIFMGQFVSVKAMAAIGACASMLNLFLNFTAGVGTGLGIVVSQYVGAKNDKLVNRASVNAVIIILSVALLIGGFGLVMMKPLLLLLDTPSDIIDMSMTYARIILSGMICSVSYNMTAAVLRGLGNTRMPLYFLIFASVLHVALDFLFILGFNMGVEGVALATVISQGISAILTLIYMYTKYPVLRFKWKDFRPDFDIIKLVCKLGVPIGLTSCCFAIGMMTIQRTINGFGTEVVAGYTAGVRVEELTWLFFTSFGHSISNYAGQNAGAKDIARIRKGTRDLALMLVGVTLACTAVAFVFGPMLIRLFVEDPHGEVFRIARGFLYVNASFYLPMGLLMHYNGVLKGIGTMKVPMISAGVELVCKVGFSILLSVIVGYFGIWFAEPIGWVLALIPPVIYYYSGKWEKHVMDLKV